MENTTRTVFGAVRQVRTSWGLPTVLIDNTTLNQAYNVLSDSVPEDGANPTLKYFGIGIGGHVNSSTTEGYPITSELTHQMSDPNLYEPIPFVLRELDNDLSSSERAKFRLRTKKTYGGVDYWTYWLKTVDDASGDLVMNYNTVIDGITTISEFVPTIENLTPNKPTLTTTDVETTSGKTLSVTYERELSLTAAEIVEIRTACEIIYGSAEVATLSEIMMCSGVDTVNTITLNDGTTTTMTEGIAIVAEHFIKGTQKLAASTTSWQSNFNMGATEPVTDAA